MATLNHIGIAIKDFPAIKKLFALLQLEVTHSEDVPDQGVTTHFLPLPTSQCSIELLQVTDLNSTVSRFLKDRGPGIHHLSFNVNSGELDLICERLIAAGFRLVYDQPKKGAHNTRINFIHPSSSGGTLIELMEPS